MRAHGRTPKPNRRGAKPRVVILGGAGAMGRITARDLARTSLVPVHVVVADRDVPARRERGVEYVVADVTDPKSLRRALDGAYATVASLPYVFNLEAMRGALEAGAHYVDLGGLFHVTRRQLRLAKEFERRGRMAILGMGSAPGILNVMAALGASRLDRVHEIHCLVGAADRTRFRNAPPLGFGYSPDTLLDEFVMPSAVFRDGEFRMVPALDPAERASVRFPQPVGNIDVDTTLHSEVATLPLSFADRGVREVTFRQGFEPEFLERLRFLVDLGLADTEPLSVAPPHVEGRRARHARGASNGNGVVPRRVLQALLNRFPPAVPIGKPVKDEVLRTVVRGTRGKRRVTVTCDCHAGPSAGFGVGPDIDTGGPPAIAVELMLTGELAIRPGVWAPEQVVPVKPFVRELERRGMKVSIKMREGDRNAL
jgi:saccharopine dehydrogenase-like NADP-dependent oxidoreductase